MSRPWFSGDEQGQTALLPVDAAAWLPRDHRAFALLGLVAELDLSAFEGYYRADGRGRPPYPPRMMLALILYCRSKGIMSGRGVAAACHDDLGARLITGNRYPDRSTIDSFISVHAAAVKGLLPQTLRLGHAEGLVDVSVVAGDGTKVGANAAMGATVDEAGLQAQIAELQQQIDAAQAAWLHQVSDGPQAQTLFTGTDGDLPARSGPAPAAGTAAWRRLHTLTGMLRRRQTALAHLQAHPTTEFTDRHERLQRDRQRVARCAERLEQTLTAVTATNNRRLTAETSTGVRTRGRRPVPVEQHNKVRCARQALATAIGRAQATQAAQPATGRVNTTDPSSAIMPGKHDGFDQRHNIQALACPNQFIIAIGTHPSSNDKQALQTLINTGRGNLDTAAITDPIGTALFDSGYASTSNLTADLPVDLLLIAVEKEARQTGRLADEASTAKPAWHIMADRLNDPDNRKLYKRRAAIIEPLFAQLFTRFGRNLNARGDQVDTELHLWAITHNLIKISRHRRRSRRPG